MNNAAVGPSLDCLLDVATAAATAGAAIANGWHQRRDELAVRTKHDANDLVSEADIETQIAIAEVIAEHFPQDRIRGEEAIGGVASVHGSGIEWFVDPIDGTTSYLYGRVDWAVSVAAVDVANGHVLAGVVIEPALGTLTRAQRGGGSERDGVRLTGSRCTALEHALVEVNLGRAEQRDRAGAMVAALTPRVRDLRRGGSAAAALAQLAVGRSDAVWVPGLQQWDGAAGMLIAAEAGAVVGDLNGTTPAVWPRSGDVLAAPPALWSQLQALLAPVYELGRVDPPADSPG